MTYIQWFFLSWGRVGAHILRGYLCIIFRLKEGANLKWSAYLKEDTDSSIYGKFLKCIWHAVYCPPPTYFARNNSRKGTPIHYGNESLHEILTLKGVSRPSHFNKWRFSVCALRRPSSMWCTHHLIKLLSYYRCQVTMHIGQCPEKAIVCPFPGCKQIFRRREWDSHMYSRAISHAVQTDGEIQRLKGMLHGKKASLISWIRLALVFLRIGLVMVTGLSGVQFGL